MTERLVSRSPQHLQDVVTECESTDPDHAPAIRVQAQAAQKVWRDQGALGRSTALLNAAAAIQVRAGDLEDLIVREVGKPRLEARGEIARAIAILNYYSQIGLLASGETLPPSGRGLLYTERRPHGVVGLITPWNFPIAIPLWKAAPALAAGNAVMLKPATAALATAQLVAEVIGACLPENLFQIVPGEAATAVALIDSADAVSFTGSTAVGHQVVLRAASRNIPAQAEMGGQNAAIVLPDAPVESTAQMLANAVAGFAGQKCTATSRVIVVGDAEPFQEALVEALRNLTLGDPSDEATVGGPVIDPQAARRVRAAADSAVTSGGRSIFTDHAMLGEAFVQPVVVAGVDHLHRVNQVETFGPFVSVLAAASPKEAVAVANGVKQGLVTSVHGTDLDAVLSIVGDVDTGLIRVNAPSTGVDFHAPFGGEKESSAVPREQGRSALEFYSSSRTITIAPSR